MKLDELQQKIGQWQQKNFGDAPSYLALIKVMEELGELASHYIGRIEHRVGKPLVDHQAEIEDAAADVVISLCVFCYRDGIDLNSMVEIVWELVSKRKFDKVYQEATDGTDK